MASNDNQLFYSPVYGRLLIAFGIIFTAIFVLGYFILDDLSTLFYCLLSAFMIFIGYNINKFPYAIYDDKTIVLYNLGAKERKRYTLQNKSDVRIKDNRFYVKGEKLKMNHWFIRRADWNRMVNFYSSSAEDLLSELKD